jgi:hypothetical protein
MTRGARPGLVRLHRRFHDRIVFVSVYVREAHPGERYPHHVSDAQKLQHARDWIAQDPVPWTVAVDTINGTTHNAYGPLPNSIYLIDRTGHVAFRALWAGQERLVRDRIAALLSREARGNAPVNLGERENLLIPLIHGAAEFDPAVVRGGRKSVEDFRRELGRVMYGLEQLMSKAKPLIHRQPAA